MPWRKARRPLPLMVAVLLAVNGAAFCAPPARAAGGEEPGMGEGASGVPARAPRTASVRFEGNASLSEDELRKAAVTELSSFQDRGRRRSDVDDAAYRMETAYRDAGYAFATVDYRLEGSGEETVAIFSVTEGPRVKVGEVAVSGSRAFRPEEIQAFFRKEAAGPLGQGVDVLVQGLELLAPPRGGKHEEGVYFVESEIKAALSGISDLYYESGYLDAEVGEPEVTFSADRKRADLALTIHEGSRYLLQRVTFGGDLPGEAKAPLEELARQFEGTPYFPRKRMLLRSRVAEVYGVLGYPEAEVAADEDNTGVPSSVVLNVSIVSGPRVRIARVDVFGNVKTRESFIKSILTQKPGDIFSLDKKRTSIHALYRTGLFSRVDLTLGEGEGEDRTLTVSVEEAPSREVFTEIGWGSYELLRGRFGYLEKNLFGRGRQAGAEFGASVRGENIGVRLEDPRFLHTSIRASLPFTYRRREEPSFTRREIGVSLILSKELGARVNGSLSYRLFVTDVSDISSGTQDEELGENYRLASLKGQLSRDTRNDVFFPTAGEKFSISAETADRALGGELSFLRLGGSARLFRSLARRTVIGLRYQTGWISPTGDQESIPLGERFFNGGENSVRSFRESELGPRDLSGEPEGGLAYNVASVELRQRFSGNLAMTLFFDSGNVSPNRSRAEPEEAAFNTKREAIRSTLRDYFRDFRPALGLGLQYLLPVGPVRLDAAFNPDASAEGGERHYTVHFSVGMAF